jgi:hypothetical protein
VVLLTGANVSAVVDARHLREALCNQPRLILDHVPVGVCLHFEDPLAADSLSSFG